MNELLTELQEKQIELKPSIQDINSLFQMKKIYFIHTFVKKKKNYFSMTNYNNFNQKIYF